MTFANPAWLAVAGLAVPLTLWYVLRSRRPRVEVASTYLWQRTDRSVAAAVPWQRFRPDRTYWLVLLALLAGAVALARPSVPVVATVGDHTILVVDTSASMSADEEGPSRLELARRAGAEVLERVGPGQTVSVVEAGPRARVALSGSADPGAARRALARLRPSQGAADLADAFTLATALQRPGQETVTLLLTDAAVAPDVAALAPPGLVVRAVGRDRPNLAVTRVQAVPTGAGSAQVFAQVRSFGQLPVQARVTVALDGEVRLEQVVELGPRGTEDLVLPLEGGGSGRADGHRVVEVAVAPVGRDVTGAAAVDALGLDDRGWAVLAEPRDVTALVAGPGNVFLESALAAVPGVEVQTAAAVPEDLSSVDLLVVDRIPAPPHAQVPTLYVAPVTAPEGVALAGPVELPALTSVDTASELLAEVDLSEVAIAAGQRVEAPALRAVAGGPSGPLLLAGRLGTAPVVYVAFDLLQSNLPLQVAWPVLVANTVSWLAGPPTAAPVVAGTALALPVPADASGLVVSPPAGEQQRLDAVSPRLRVDEVGVWRAEPVDADGEAVGAALAVAVNADPAESDLARPRPDAVRPAADGGPQPAAGAAPEGRRVFGRELLPLVLAVLLGEWVLSHSGLGRRRRKRGRVRRRRGAGAAGAGQRVQEPVGAAR